MAIKCPVLIHSLDFVGFDSPEIIRSCPSTAHTEILVAGGSQDMKYIPEPVEFSRQESARCWNSKVPDVFSPFQVFQGRSKSQEFSSAAWIRSVVIYPRCSMGSFPVELWRKFSLGGVGVGHPQKWKIWGEQIQLWWETQILWGWDWWEFPVGILLSKHRGETRDRNQEWSKDTQKWELRLKSQPAAASIILEWFPSCSGVRN